MAIFPDRECPRLVRKKPQILNRSPWPGRWTTRPPREQPSGCTIAVDRCHRSREALDRLAIAEEIVCRDGNIDGQTGFDHRCCHRGMYGQGTYFASQLSTTARLLDSVVKRTKSLKRRTWITCCRQMHGQHIGHRASSRPCASLCHKPYCLFCHGQHDGHAHRASPWLSHVRLVRAFHGRRPPVRERLVDVPPVTCQHFCKTKNQNEYISLTITTHRQQ